MMMQTTLLAEAVPSPETPSTDTRGAAVMKADSVSLQPKGTELIKREHDPVSQLRIGLTLMAFIAIVMVLSNNFNPE